MLAAVQQRLARPADLRAVLRSGPRLPRRQLLLEAVADAEGGVHSLPEREWSAAVRRAGLPEPTRQSRVRRADGMWYLDAEFTPWGVSVEVNGTQHGNVCRAERDDHRRNVLGTSGRLVITLSSHVVRHDQAGTAVVTAAALLSRGWQPPPRVLRRLEGRADKAGLDLRTGDDRAADGAAS